LEWHHSVFDYSDEQQAARGVAIRQWGPQGRVFLYAHLQGQNLEQSAEVVEWECLPAGGGFDYCENIFIQNLEAVGPTNTGEHLLHPAAAIRNQGGGELELYLSRAVDDYYISCPDTTEGAQWDLVSYVFEPDHSGVNDIVYTIPINAAIQQTSECNDYGITELTFDGSEPHACYTMHSGSDELVQCNHYNSIPQDEWGAPASLANNELLDPGWIAEEDHPSFVISPNGRIVAAHRHNYGPVGQERQNIEVTFPDGDTVYLDDWGTSNIRKNFPNTSRNYDTTLGKHVLRVVWEYESGNLAKLKYGSCHTDCDDLANWSLEEITAAYKDAQKVQHVVDGPARREFITFSYDSEEPGFGNTARVVVATRCIDAGPVWDFQEIRPAPSPTGDDQKLNYGRPSIALDKANSMLMVAFVEASNWGLGNRWQSNSDGDVVFARADYSGLPQCN
jgi:hypothetical protein